MHSPTPWTIRPHLPDAHFEVVADAEGNTVGTATRRDDAALIVDAVNDRDRLRDLVGKLAARLQLARLMGFGLPEREELLDEAKKALKEGGAE